jgi:exopolyphosphatase/guanosine-5'-triphosphate,3'-diphosphate pyrophosphatase
VSLERTDPLIRVSFLREILAATGPLDLAARREIKGLSPQRADVFPTALVTIITLAELGAVGAFHHSLRNLRWGVAARVLAQESAGGGGA